MHGRGNEHGRGHERGHAPLEETRRLSFSTTSRKISFLRCLIPSERHDTVLVSATGGRGATSSRFPSCVMYSLVLSGAVVSGGLCEVILVGEGGDKECRAIDSKRTVISWPRWSAGTRSPWSRP